MSTVGKIREQSALCPADERLVIVTKDKDVAALGLHVIRVYPDTTDEHGNWGGTFKIEVERTR